MAAAETQSGVIPDDQKKTFREFFKTYNKMSETCFNKCVWDFGVASMRGREERCVMKCVSHYLSATQEIQRVFAEDQASVIATGSVRTDTTDDSSIKS